MHEGPDGPLDHAGMRQHIIDVSMAIPHSMVLGIEYGDHGENWAQMRMPYSPNIVAYPENGVIASGAIFTLMDNTAGMAFMMALGKFEPAATLDLRCDYLRPAKPEHTVIGHIECYRVTKRFGFVRGIAHDGDPDDPVAHVAGTFVRSLAK